jgi:hypothetical protein
MATSLNYFGIDCTTYVKVFCKCKRLCYYRLLSQTKSPSSVSEQEWERIAALSVPSQKQCEDFIGDCK